MVGLFFIALFAIFAYIAFSGAMGYEIIAACVGTFIFCATGSFWPAIIISGALAIAMDRYRQHLLDSGKYVPKD